MLPPQKTNTGSSITSWQPPSNTSIVKREKEGKETHSQGANSPGERGDSSTDFSGAERTYSWAELDPILGSCGEMEKAVGPEGPMTDSQLKGPESISNLVHCKQ